MERLAGVTLKPGMPAESIIHTGSRTPLNYLLKPFTDSITRTMKKSDGNWMKPRHARCPARSARRRATI